MQAAPDGYTLMMVISTPLSIGPFVLDKQPYDAVKQFAHVFYAGSAPVLFMASPKAGINSLADLAKLATSLHETSGATLGGVPFGSGARTALVTLAVFFQRDGSGWKRQDAACGVQRRWADDD